MIARLIEGVVKAAVIGTVVVATGGLWLAVNDAYPEDTEWTP
jgi:hypothetical protein